VRNDSGVRIRHVAAFTSGRAVLVGDLAPGEERAFELDDADRLANPVQDVWTDPDAEQFTKFGVFPQIAPPGKGVVVGGAPAGGIVGSNGGGRFGETTTDEGPTPGVSFPMWSAYRRAFGYNADALGLVVVGGWPETDDAPVHLDGGGSLRAGRSLVVARAVVAAPGDSVSDMAVQSRLVRGLGFGKVAGPVNAAGPSLTMSFRVPAGADQTRPLVLGVPSWVSTIEVWDGSGWVRSQATQARDAARALPTSWFRDGVLFVRAAIRPEQRGAIDEPIVVRARRADDVMLEDAP
jgi:hypothetical protein